MEKCPTGAFLGDDKHFINKLDLICKYDTDISSQNIKILIDSEKCARWYLPTTPGKYKYFVNFSLYSLIYHTLHLSRPCLKRSTFES